MSFWSSDFWSSNFWADGFWNGLTSVVPDDSVSSVSIILSTQRSDIACASLDAQIVSTSSSALISLTRTQAQIS